MPNVVNSLEFGGVIGCAAARCDQVCVHMGGVRFGNEFINSLKIRSEGIAQAGIQAEVDGDRTVGEGFIEHSFPIRTFDEIHLDLFGFNQIDQWI